MIEDSEEVTSQGRPSVVVQERIFRPVLWAMGRWEVFAGPCWPLRVGDRREVLFGGGRRMMVSTAKLRQVKESHDKRPAQPNEHYLSDTRIQHSAHETCDARGAKQVVRRASLGMVWPRLQKHALRQMGRLAEAADMWQSHALHEQNGRANETRLILSDGHIEVVGQLCQGPTPILS
jgi:hypothetical protein